MVIAHIAGIPVEEWLLPWISAGAALAGLRASFGRRAHRFGRAAHSKRGRDREDIEHDAQKGLHR